MGHIKTYLNFWFCGPLGLFLGVERRKGREKSVLQALEHPKNVLPKNVRPWIIFWKQKTTLCDKNSLKYLKNFLFFFFSLTVVFRDYGLPMCFVQCPATTYSVRCPMSILSMSDPLSNIAATRVADQGVPCLKRKTFVFLGIAKDGFLIYGRYEWGQKLPELDECGGHCKSIFFNRSFISTEHRNKIWNFNLKLKKIKNK